MRRFLIILTVVLLLLIGCAAAEKENAVADVKPAQDGSVATSRVKILSQEKRGEELVTCYDPAMCYELPVRQFETAIAAYHLERDYTSQELTDLLGEDGIVVEGTATGIREGHLSETDAYTITEFAVEAIHYGEENASTVRVRECLSLVSQNGRAFYRCIKAGSCRPLRNDTPVVLILVYENGAYVPIIDPISVEAPSEKGAEILNKFGITK